MVASDSAPGSSNDGLNQGDGRRVSPMVYPLEVGTGGGLSCSRRSREAYAQDGEFGWRSCVGGCRG